jgi:tetratricopeptide (TPR) repeat protein
MEERETRSGSWQRVTEIIKAINNVVGPGVPAVILTSYNRTESIQKRKQGRGPDPLYLTFLSLCPIIHIPSFVFHLLSPRLARPSFSQQTHRLTCSSNIHTPSLPPSSPSFPSLSPSYPTCPSKPNSRLGPLLSMLTTRRNSKRVLTFSPSVSLSSQYPLLFLTCFNQTIADSSKILTNLGLIYATLGEHEAAVEQFMAATRLDNFLAVAFVAFPSSPPFFLISNSSSYFQCGVSNFLLGRYDVSVKDFEDALLYLRGNQSMYVAYSFIASYR